MLEHRFYRIMTSFYNFFKTSLAPEPNKNIINYKKYKKYNKFLNLDIYTFQKQPPEVFYKKKLFLQNSQENTCARVYFFKTLLKQRLWHGCFPVNFVKFLRTRFFHNTYRRLPLCVVYRRPLDDCFYYS